jgi:hypothetical protein
MGMRIDTWVITLAILLIIGIILAVKSIQTTTPYYTQYFKNLACSYKAFFTGEFKTYTTCSTNALKAMWDALQAWPRLVTQELGWW